MDLYIFFFDIQKKCVSENLHLILQNNNKKYAYLDDDNRQYGREKEWKMKLNLFI